MAVLLEVDTGREFRLEAPSMTLGRSSDCDARIIQPMVSARHAMILRTNDGYFISDLGSSNGTKVNGRTITEATRLTYGDSLDLGGVQLEFLDSGRPRPVFSLTQPDKVDLSTLKNVDASGTVHGGTSADAKLQAVMEISRNLSTALNVREVLPKILETLFSIFPQTDRGFILLREGSNSTLTPAAVHQKSPEGATPAISSTIIDRVVQSGRAMLSDDASMDSRFDPSHSIRAHQIRSIMCVPMMTAAGANLGVIQLDTADGRGKYIQKDLDVLASASMMAARAIELTKMHEVRRDLEAATQIQKGFLPHYPPKAPGLSFFDYYASAQQVGGDYFDYIPLPGDRLAVAVGDVAGKGVSAALLMARLSAAVRFCLASEPTLGAAVRKINANLIEADLDGRFVTLVMGMIDLPSRQSSWVIAGHLAPLLRRGNVVAPVGEALGDIPLGVVDRPFEETRLVLEPGDLILLCTDGLFEARNPVGDLYGESRLRQRFAEAPSDVHTLGAFLLADLRKFVAGRAPHDDVTMVAVGVD